MLSSDHGTLTPDPCRLRRHVDLDLLGLGFRLLGQFQLQHTRIVAGLDVLRIHAGRQREGAEEAAIAPLDAVEVLLLLSLDPRRLILDFDLRELSLDRCHDLRVFRLSAGASQRIAGVGGIFNRIAPGFRKDKIAFRQIFPLRVSKFCHS